jgi:hypothetical protein
MLTLKNDNFQQFPTRLLRLGNMFQQLLENAQQASSIILDML